MSKCIGFDENKVHEIYPEASMISAMKIWTAPKDKTKDYCDSGLYLASIKKDGYFYQFNKTENYNYMFSRAEGVNGLLTEKSANVPHLVERLKTLPKDTLLIGEIFVEGGTSKDVTKIMGCLPQKAVQRQKETAPINYYLNDIIMYNGVSLINTPFEKRLAILQKICEKHDLLCDYISLAENIEVDIYDFALEQMAQGEEGIVLKKKSSLYTPGKRPAKETLKIKTVDYADVVISGFCLATHYYKGKEIENWQYWERTDGTLARGSYYGVDGYTAITKPHYNNWYTAIEISGYNSNGTLVKIGTISSGLSDEFCKKISENPNEYINKVCMVECMSLDKKEKTIRHGFFKGVREDKSAADCLLSEIFK